MEWSPKFLEMSIPETSPEEIAKARDRAKLAIGILSTMSECPEGWREVVSHGGLAAIANCLSCPVDVVLFVAITTVHTVMEYPVKFETDLVAAFGKRKYSQVRYAR